MKPHHPEKPMYQSRNQKRNQPVSSKMGGQHFPQGPCMRRATDMSTAGVAVTLSMWPVSGWVVNPEGRTKTVFLTVTLEQSRN